MLYSGFSLVIYFIHSRVYTFIPISQFIPPHFSPVGVHMFVLYVWISISALQINIHGLAQFWAAAAELLQSCPTLCNPVDGSPPGSPVPGILQARTLEWVAISFSNAWKWKVKVKSLSRVRLFSTPWTAVYQAPLSMGFSRQEYWSGVPLPSPVLSTRAR